MSKKHDDSYRCRTPFVRLHHFKGKPWLDRRGIPLSEEKLREVSRHWSRSMWERYLRTFETEQTEYLSPHSGDIQYAGTGAITQWLYENSSAAHEESDERFPESTVAALHKALESLTFRERQVIDGIFYERLTQRQTALQIGVSRERVNYLLKHSLRKLRARIEELISRGNVSGGSALPKGEGHPISRANPVEKCRSEIISESQGLTHKS